MVKLVFRAGDVHSFQAANRNHAVLTSILNRWLRDSALEPRRLKSLVEKSGVEMTPQEKMRIEAIIRLSEMKVKRKVIERFSRHGTVPLFATPFGIAYQTDQLAARAIKKFEKEYHAMVYAVIRVRSRSNELDSLLYVSESKNSAEWETEHLDSSGYVFSFTWNYACPDLSTFNGVILKRTICGGLARKR